MRKRERESEICKSESKGRNNTFERTKRSLEACLGSSTVEKERESEKSEKNEREREQRKGEIIHVAGNSLTLIGHTGNRKCLKQQGHKTEAPSLANCSNPTTTCYCGPHQTTNSRHTPSQYNCYITIVCKIHYT